MSLEQRTLLQGRVGRQQKINAQMSHCCAINSKGQLEAFYCTQFSTNGTETRVGEAHCCRPSVILAYCCSADEYSTLQSQQKHVHLSCDNSSDGPSGRWRHRRNMVPRVALAVGALIVLILVAAFVYYCVKKRLMTRKHDGRVQGWFLPGGGVVRQDSEITVAPVGAPGELITPYQQRTGVYTLPASDHPVQYIGGSQCPLREYGPLQPAYPGRQFTAGPPPQMPRVAEVT